MKHTTSRLLRLGLALLFGASLLAFSARPAHAANFNWCINMDVDFTDTDIGEDYLLDAQGNPLGRYLWVRLSRLDGSKTWPLTYLDGLGCLPFSDTTNGPFKLEVRSQARVPRSDNAANTNTVRVLNAADDLAEWTFNYTFPAAGGNHSSTLPQTRRTNLLAVGIHAYVGFSDGLANKTVTIHDATCPSYDTPTSCASGNGGGAAEVYILPGHDEKKFLVAHEVGHTVQWLWFNFNQPGSYSINDGGAACEWSNPMDLAIRYHALHTKEHSSIAFTEGFAQYYATYIYNKQPGRHRVVSLLQGRLQEPAGGHARRHGVRYRRWRRRLPGERVHERPAGQGRHGRRARLGTAALGLPHQRGRRADQLPDHAADEERLRRRRVDGGKHVGTEPGRRRGIRRRQRDELRRSVERLRRRERRRPLTAEPCRRWPGAMTGARWSLSSTAGTKPEVWPWTSVFLGTAGSGSGLPAGSTS